MLEILLGIGGGAKTFYPDSGPGPKGAVGTPDVAYFGEVTNAELFTADELIALIPTLAGSKIVAADSDVWLKFLYYGKYLFIKKRVLFYNSAANNSTTWNKLYRAGLIYGEDGNGTYNDGFPTLQLKIIPKGEYRFKVRTITGDEGHTTTLPATSGQDVGVRRKSMFTELLWRVSDQIHPLYPEKKWDNTPATSMSDRYELTREVFVSTAYPKGNSCARFRIGSQPNWSQYTNGSSRTQAWGWRPVLELAKGDEIFQVRHTSTLVVGGTIIPPDHSYVGTGDPQRVVDIQILSQILSAPIVKR